MAADFKNLSVAIIEDDAHALALLKGLLGKFGVTRTVEAADGQQGYELVKKVRPLLVLCDVRMEPVGGIQFLEMLRADQDSSLAKTPVIFLTADLDQDTTVRARQLNVDAYLLKPPSLSALKSRIDTVMMKANARPTPIPSGPLFKR